jgi:glycosyltransferase involved in cell wall biosynthesis
MTEPLVSVGIPTYNNPEGLENTLFNFLCQSYENLEIIVSVNPSVNEETNTKYQEISERYKNIKWHFQEKNIGLIDNFWFVLEQATGKYFMYAQDDDEWSLGFINGLVSLLESNPSVPVAMSKVQRRDDTGKIFDTFDMKNISVLNAMHDENLAFIFMGVWRWEKLQEYSEGRATDIAIDAQALLDGGVLIDTNELYTKGLRHDKAKEQIQGNPFWYFHIYLSLLKGVYRIDRTKVPIVAATNFVWLIRSYAAQILFLLPVDHPIRKTVRKLISHS